MEPRAKSSRSRLAKIAAIVVVLLIYTSCLGKSDNAEVRYRVTVVVDEKGIKRQGSAVWSLTLSRPLLPLADAYNVAFHGDAIPIKLSNGGVLFVLLQSWFPEKPSQASRNPGVDASRIPRLLFHDRLPYLAEDDIKLLSELKSTNMPIGLLICPKTGMLTWLEPKNSLIPTAAFCFRMAYSHIPADRKELKPFDPACAYFQKDCIIRVRKVTVQITDDAVDRPLTTVIPWIKEYSTKRIFEDLAHSKPGLPQTLFVIRR